jgi:hypothetical protein
VTIDHQSGKPRLDARRRDSLISRTYQANSWRRLASCRSHPARREGGRSPSAGSDQVPTRLKPEDREGARPNDPTDTARPRRRGDRMKRRDFIAGVGSAAVWPLVARARQGDHPRSLSLEQTSDPLSPAIPMAWWTGWVLWRGMAGDAQGL